MELIEHPRALDIRGINILGENVEVDNSANLISMVLFFDPVSKVSLESLNIVQAMAHHYESLSVGFWYVMEPRLSCMYQGNIAKVAFERLCLPANAIFDANSMIVLQAGIKAVPALIVIDSKSFIKSRYEGEISFREAERAIQARLALSGYKNNLPSPTFNERTIKSHISQFHSGTIMRQLGYATGDYLFTSLVVPESDQQFSLPNFYLSNTIYPHGSWFVGRDFIEGKTGSTVYISCSSDESVQIFAGSEDGAVVKIHTSIEPDQHITFGKDVVGKSNAFEITINDFRSYEVLATSGDAEVMISLQISSGSLKLYCVEYCQYNPLVGINI